MSPNAFRMLSVDQSSPSLRISSTGSRKNNNKSESKKSQKAYEKP
jgi:hypothetical protein